MKNFSILFTMFLFCIAFVSCIEQELYNGLKIDGDKIEVRFNHKMDKEQLTKIQRELVAVGITLEYDLMEFNEYGDLSALGFSVKCKDGTHGAASTESLDERADIGFFCDCDKNAKVSFSIGSI